LLTPRVSLRNLNKHYGDFAAVDDISLEIQDGEFLTFLGSSGSGKSTTLSMLAGFETPSSGEILVDGKSLVNVPPHKRDIGMVFQRYSLFPHLSVRDNIAFPLAIRKLASTERERRVDAMLKLVQLGEFAHRRPSQLSGGQQQRVAIARALVYEPRILLMDEPLGALDKKLREDLQDELRQLHRRLGITIVYVTHDQEEAMRLSSASPFSAMARSSAWAAAMTSTRTRRTPLSPRSWATPTSSSSRPRAMLRRRSKANRCRSA